MQGRQIKYPPRISRLKAFLDSSRMKKSPVQVFQEYKESLGETYMFHFGGIKEVMVTSNPSLIGHVLKDNYENYQKSEIEMKRMVHFLGKGLLTSHGKYWLSQRRLIQQGFHKNQLELMMAGMREVMEESMNGEEKNFQQGEVNIHQVFNKITFRMVMRSLFSTSLKEYELDRISHTISEIQEFLVKQVVQPYLNPWFKIAGVSGRYDKMRYEADKIIYDYIKIRRNEARPPSDLLQILLDSKYSESGEGMDDLQVLAESVQLMVAGHETTSTALSWILYLLCRHPDSLEKIRDEISREIGDSALQFSDIPKFVYTTQVIDESLRLYPPFWMVDRVAVEDDHLNGLDIPKRTTVIVLIYGVHHSSEYWENPEEFIPERFSVENRKNHAPYTHLPFGAGPKGCIGGNYAMMQMILILVSLLKRYNFELAEDKNIDIQSMLILRPKDGIKMRLTKRGSVQEEFRKPGIAV
jgi:cytochrome P450